MRALKLSFLAIAILFVSGCQKDETYQNVYNQLSTDLQPFLWTDLPIVYNGQDIFKNYNTTYTLNGSLIAGNIKTKVYAQYISTEGSNKVYDVVGYSEYTFDSSAFPYSIQLSVNQNQAVINVIYMAVSPNDREYTGSYVITIKDSDLLNSLTIGNTIYSNVYSYTLDDRCPYQVINLSKDYGLLSVTNWQNQELQLKN
jgi:hypothetical protein